jgi:glycosyltransferase involved in cell wall biosynthesis
VLSRNVDASIAQTRTEVQDGVVVHRMQPPGVDFPVYGRTTYLLGYSWYVLRALHEVMQQATFDVIDFPEFGGEGFAYQLDRTVWNWLPVVVNIHGPLAMFAEHFGWPEKTSRYYQAASFMEQFSIHRADAVMAVSSTIADLASRAYGFPRDQIDLVYCGVDTDLFHPGRGREHEAQKPTVLFVGNITENKGIDTLFDAIMRLRDKYPNICLQILGKEDNELAPRFRQELRAKRAYANVQFRGFVDRSQLPEFYRQAHVYCSPAEFEGLGTTYLEAMSCGCPVVASTAGGTPESVLDGKTGLLVPRRDVAATAAALDRILGDSSLRQRMSQAGRERVVAEFSDDVFINRVLKVYEKAIARSEASPARLQDARE